MSYTINLTNGSALIPGGLSDGTVDTSHSPLTLIGKNYAGYGQFLNDNFVHLLENFAYTTSPSNPLVGQLWWDTTNNILKVYTGNTTGGNTGWKVSTGATSASTQPTDLSASGGDLWFDSVNQQLKVWNGTGTWVTIGPPSVTQAIPNNYTGAIPTNLTDTTNASQPVVALLISGTIYAVIAKSAFSTSLSGFSSVKPGLNLNTTVTGIGLNTQDANPTNSTLVQRTGSGGINATTGTFTGAVTAASLTTSGVVTATGGLSGSLTGNVSATTVSATTVSAQGVSASSGITGTILTASQPNITSLGTLTSLSISGTATLNGVGIATVGGSASFSSINGTPIGNVTPSTAAFTSVTINTGLVPASNLVVNLGSSTAWFGGIYGTAVHAQYADLAERFESDVPLDPGTVVEMGGSAEITAVGEDLSDNVFGVISTNAAYLMNSKAGTDNTHPPVAVQGRVPVKVIGKIKKGDRLVSAGNGMARAGAKNEISTWNVIGRALEDKINDGEGIIEAVVKLNS
jgi:hypothetical protein